MLEGGFADVVAFAAAAGGGEGEGEAVGYSLCIGFLREREGGKGHDIGNFWRDCIDASDIRRRVWSINVASGFWILDAGSVM